MAGSLSSTVVGALNEENVVNCWVSCRPGVGDGVGLPDTTVEIGTGTTRIGRSSYSFLQAVFHEGECAATANATMVMIDRATRKARPLPDDVIARLEELRIRE